MHAVLYNITNNSVGEHIRNFAVTENDLVLADRMYSSVSGIEYCIGKGCQFIARMRINSFKSYDEAGNQIDLLSFIKAKEAGELYAYVKKSVAKTLESFILFAFALRKNLLMPLILQGRK